MGEEEMLGVVEFPSFLDASSKFLGKFTSTDLLIMLGATILVMKVVPPGKFALAAGAVTFGLMMLFKLIMPEEVGLLFPVYLAKFALVKREVKAAEVDATQSLVGLENTDTIAGSYEEIGYAKLSDGSLIGVVRVEPVNYFYSRPSEQKAYLTTFRTMVDAIDFPIKILALVTKFDGVRYINRQVLRMRDEDIATNHVLSEVAEDYVRWFDSVMQGIYQRHYFVVVKVGKVKSEEYALSELRRRLDIVVSALISGGIKAKALTKNEILQIYEMFNAKSLLPANYESTKAFLGGGQE